MQAEGRRQKAEGKSHHQSNSKCEMRNSNTPPAHSGSGYGFGVHPAAVGIGRDRDSNRCPGQMAASVNSDRNPGQFQLITAAAPDI